MFLFVEHKEIKQIREITFERRGFDT